MTPEGLLERIAADRSTDDPRAASFARGLVLGALVGAAIAGSTIWQRRHARTVAEQAADGDPAPTDEPRIAEDPSRSL